MTDRLVARGHSVALLALFACACTGEPSTPVVGPEGVWGSVGTVEELRVGVGEGPEALMFAQVRTVAVAPDGRFWVANGLPLEVREFAADGTFVRRVGRKGQGPGEYQSVQGLASTPDDLLVVWDPVSRRLSLFDREGALASELSVVEGVWGSDSDLTCDDDGHLWVRSTRRALEGASEFEATQLLIQLDREGRVLQEIELPGLPRPANGEHGFVLMSPEGPLVPFTSATTWALSPEGFLVVGAPDAYRIELRRQGSPAVITRDVQPEAVAEEEWSQWDAWASYIERTTREQIAAENARYGETDDVTYEVIDIPRVKPHLRALHVGADGRIWAQRHVAAEHREQPPRPEGDERPILNWREPVVLDAFEPDGTFLGTVTLPRSARVLAMDGESIWTVHTDDAGVERILRLRVDRSAPLRGGI